VAIHEDIRDAAVTALRTLTFAGVPDARVVGMELADDALLLPPKPCVVVSYRGVELMRGGTNERDDIGYPLLVSLYDVGKPNSTSRAGPDVVTFRNQVRVLFNNRVPAALAALGHVYNCEFNPNPAAVFDDKSPLFESLQTAVEVIAVARVPRS